MKRFFTYLLAFAAVTTVISCSKSDGPEEPLPGPTITWATNPDFKPLDITDKMDVKIKVDAPAGIKTFKVAIESDALKDLGITEIDLIEPDENIKPFMDQILGNAGSPKDKTSYSLDLSTIVPLINGLTHEESDHKFTVRIVDKNDQTATRTAVFRRIAEHNSDNYALKVNRFTAFNVKSIEGKTVTFYDKLDYTMPSDPKTSYFTYEKLKEMGLTNSDGSEILMDVAGNRYRLPTEGEMSLLVPKYQERAEDMFRLFVPLWNDNEQSNGQLSMAEEATTEGWDESINVDGKEISGRSWLKRGETSASDIDIMFVGEDVRKVNFAPVYGLRFQGTSQCAAYRWESCKAGADEQERYLSIKIKALNKDDTTTKIDDIAKESFWTGGYIEFKLPALGRYTSPTEENVLTHGICGYYWSSTPAEDPWSGELSGLALYFSPTYTAVDIGSYPYMFSLRLVKVEN